MKRVVVIGGGPAGLTAAFELLNRPSDYDVVILEADSTIGGIAKSVCFNGNIVDIGGHRFFTKDERVNAFWQNILPSRNGQNERGFLVRQRRSHILYDGMSIPYPLELDIALLRDLGVGYTASAAVSYIRALLHRREEVSLEDFYINRFGEKVYRTFFDDYTQKVWGRSAADISCDWGSQRVKGVSAASALKHVFSMSNSSRDPVSFTDRFYYPARGCGQFWDALAERITEKAGRIELNRKVIALECTGNRISCVKTSDGHAYVGDYFISSMPIDDLIGSLDAEIPGEVAAAASGLPYRSFISVAVCIPKQGVMDSMRSVILENNWLYVQDPSVSLGRIQIFNNWSPEMLAHPETDVLLGLEYFCSFEDTMWKKSDADLYALGISDLQRLRILKDKPTDAEYHVERVEKAYPGYYGSYSAMPQIRSYINHYTNLYCVGRNGQHRYNNMDHSILTATAAVDCILQGESKEAVWSINSEKSYNG